MAVEHRWLDVARYRFGRRSLVDQDDFAPRVRRRRRQSHRLRTRQIQKNDVVGGQNRVRRRARRDRRRRNRAVRVERSRRVEGADADVSAARKLVARTAQSQQAPGRPAPRQKRSKIVRTAASECIGRQHREQRLNGSAMHGAEAPDGDGTTFCKGNAAPATVIGPRGVSVSF